MSDGKSNEKGKGRAPVQETEDSGPPDESLPPQSFFSRITASATGLTRTTFTAPTANELSNQAATAFANSNKGQSLGRNDNESSAWTESSKIAPQTDTSQTGAGSAGLRNQHHDQHIQQSEKEFSSFLDGIDSFTPSEDFGTIADRGSENVSEEDAWEKAQTSHVHDSRAQERTVAEQEARDGESVLAILSSPGVLEDDLEVPVENADYDWGLSSDQLIQIRAMAREMFPPPEPHGAVAADHPLNMHPAFEGEPSKATGNWREQWDGVLARYTDEVWGGLLPLVKQARQEIVELDNKGIAKEKPTALRRLEAILGQLQKR